MEIWPGTAYPLGATFDGAGTNFALFSEVADRWANFDMATGKMRIAGVNSDSNVGVDPDRNNFAPRFGFAYQLGSGTVVRGGYGIYYNTQGHGGVAIRLQRRLTPDTGDDLFRPPRRRRPVGAAQVVVEGQDDMLVTPMTGGTLVAAKSRQQLQRAREIVSGKGETLAKADAFTTFPEVPKGFFFLGMAQGLNDEVKIPAQAQVLREALQYEVEDPADQHDLVPSVAALGDQIAGRGVERRQDLLFPECRCDGNYGNQVERLSVLRSK